MICKIPLPPSFLPSSLSSVCIFIFFYLTSQYLNHAGATALAVYVPPTLPGISGRGLKEVRCSTYFNVFGIDVTKNSSAWKSYRSCNMT